MLFMQIQPLVQCRMILPAIAGIYDIQVTEILTTSGVVAQPLPTAVTVKPSYFDDSAELLSVSKVPISLTRNILSFISGHLAVDLNPMLDIRYRVLSVEPSSSFVFRFSTLTVT